MTLKNLLNDKPTQTLIQVVSVGALVTIGFYAFNRQNDKPELKYRNYSAYLVSDLDRSGDIEKSTIYTKIGPSSIELMLKIEEDGKDETKLFLGRLEGEMTRAPQWQDHDSDGLMDIDIKLKRGKYSEFWIFKNLSKNGNYGFSEALRLY